jgi:hypothetical protein
MTRPRWQSEKLTVRESVNLSRLRGRVQRLFLSSLRLVLVLKCGRPLRDGKCRRQHATFERVRQAQNLKST